MRKIWGIPVRDLWKCENGEPFEPDDLHPVVFSDILHERVLGIRKQDEDDAVIVHSYDPTMDRGRARDFAYMVWGKPETWTKPDVNLKTVSCLGAPACDACIGNPLPALDTAHSWRIRSFALSDSLIAKHLPTETDHLLTEVIGEHDMERIHAELLRRCVALFGEPYDCVNGEISPPYSLAYETGPR